MARGYLVIQITPNDRAFGKPPSVSGYRGVHWLPPFSVDEFVPGTAADDYVFGDYVDETSGLIPDFSKAYDLLKRLQRERPRPYEILYCRTGHDMGKGDLPAYPPMKFYGYDVAGITGDKWSVLYVFPSGAWAATYRTKLNDFGLFPQKKTAERFLEEYVTRGEPDPEGLEVVEVFGVLLEKLEAEGWKQVE